jgi:FkbM family methyltransferase
VQQTQLPPFVLSYRNREEFFRIRKEIFSQHSYYFETENPRPKIIDAGAHIGLATLYFKKLFPGARITAIEPLPQNLEVLEENIWQNGLKDIEVIPAALWPYPGEIPFHFDETDEEWLSTASTLAKAWNQEQDTTSVSVRTTALSNLLYEPVDFLKMDIEGAEQVVLEEAEDQLHWIKEMVVEFHPVAHQSLSHLVPFLEGRGFHITLWKDGVEVKLNRARGLLYVHAKQRG